MLIDVNAYLGHFAFRQLRHNTAAGLLELMDRKGIDRAAVSSASAITYRNAQAGNEEVAAEVKSHRDRLIPLAVINPAYVGWRDDLEICHQEFGMKGLRLYPKWHNYKLTDPACRELIAAATERQMAVSIPIRAEDARQRSWLADVPDVPLAELVELVQVSPVAQFLFVNGIRFDNSPLGQKGQSMPSNYMIDLVRQPGSDRGVGYAREQPGRGPPGVRQRHAVQLSRSGLVEPGTPGRQRRGARENPLEECSPAAAAVSRIAARPDCEPMESSYLNLSP